MGDLFASRLDLVVAVISTVIVFFVFIQMSVGYTQKRAHQRYAVGKDKAPSLPSFTNLSKLLFVFAMVLTVTSYWWQLPSAFLFHDSVICRVFGALLVFFGYVGLKHSFGQLDTNYSPLFDAYKPFTITTSGVYTYIRHPIYLFNLCVSFGLAISSGLFVVVITALIGLVFVMRALFMEERFLSQQFPEYESYRSHTWRFIPYVF